MRHSFEEGIHLVRLVLLGQNVAQIGAEGFVVLVHTGRPGQRVAGGPGPAAGPGRGTAADVGLLHHDDPEAVVGSGDCCGQPSGSGSDHQDIAVQGGELGLQGGRRRLRGGAPFMGFHWVLSQWPWY